MSRPLAFALLLGLPAAVVSLCIAFLMTGAGHGWITPFWFSLAGLLLFPVGVWSFVAPARRAAAPIYGILLALALACNGQLYMMSAAEGWQYFHRVAPFNYIWLALWPLWQFAILGALLSALRKPAQ